MAKKQSLEDRPATPKVLYRKYRPTKLAEVVGQEQITTTLANSLKQGKISHAYLFIGPRGTGKTSVARIFAHAVNDFEYSVEDNYLDIIEIDAASNTGVDNIRELREKSIVAPTKGKYKVYIIDEVHMLTKSASNALLKTLEEPPAHVIFIMATTDAHKVPITISSRTQIHTFQLANPETMFCHLRKVADTENIPIEDDALKVIVQRGGGSFRDSLSLLDQAMSLSEGRITANAISGALGLPQEQTIQELLTSYQNHSVAQIQSTLKNLLNAGIRPETIASELINAIIFTPTPETIALLEHLPTVQPPFPEAKLTLALLAPALHQDQAKSSPNTNIAKPTTVTSTPRKPTAKAATPSAKPSEPQDTSQTKPLSPQSFAWQDFLDRVHADSNAVFLQLQKVTHEFDGNTLHLFPTQKFTKTILEKPGNRQIIAQHLGDIALVVHDLDERPAPEDATLSQISAIMGDIREINGDTPF